MCADTQKDNLVDVCVQKRSGGDMLGMDVKHVRGRLVVVQILEGGAVHRANEANAG